MKSKINLIFIFTLFLKLCIGVVLPLFGDEAYYWVWSKNLQLSYYDHPGMIAWLLSLGTPFENFLSGVRVPAIILGHTTLWIWFQILRPHVQEKSKPWLALALLLTPLSGMGSIIMTPDLPLMFFWSLSLLFFLKATNDGDTRYYILLGVSLGLGFCSKYHMVLFVPLALIWMYLCRHTVRVTLLQFLLTFIFGTIFSFPVWYWNWQHEWISFKFQIDHGLGQKTFNPLWTLKYIVEQILILFPLIFILAIKSLKKRELLWLSIFGWGPIIFFLFTSFKGRVEANWPIAAYPALIGLAVYNAGEKLKWIKATVGFWLVCFLFVLVQLFVPQTRVKALTSKLKEIEFVDKIRPLALDHEPLYLSTYQSASLLWFMQKKPFYKLKNVGRRDFFDYLEGSTPKSKIYYWVAPSRGYLPEWALLERHNVVTKESIETDMHLFEVTKP